MLNVQNPVHFKQSLIFQKNIQHRFPVVYSKYIVTFNFNCKIEVGGIRDVYWYNRDHKTALCKIVRSLLLILLL